MTYFKLIQKNLMFFDALRLLGNYDNQKAFIIHEDKIEGLYFDDDGVLQSISVENMQAYGELNTTITKEQIFNDKMWRLYVAIEQDENVVSIDMGV